MVPTYWAGCNTAPAAISAPLKEQTMSRMSPRGGGVNRRLQLFIIRGLIITEKKTRCLN